ncbi:porin [Ideonella sp. A 288]|uniref:porin n=1 Tax=Ideonella sp. A 288 TaxID=1962181 RepID=UPI000B4AC6AA|nr:porin [Ideonella sp. A 288]
MKHSKILPAALLALCGAAQAQSNVTLFGLLDLNLNHYSAGSKSGGSGLTALTDGTANGANGSRWGVRTTEDLGGGMRAGAWLESGVLVDTGAFGQGGRAFGRQAFVSLSATALGELRIGRQYVLSDTVVGQGNPYGNAMAYNPTTSVTNAGKNLPLFLNASRVDNIIQLQTSALGPVTLAAQYGFGENTTDNFTGLRGVYASGPLYLGATYEWNKSRSTGSAINKSLSASANYDFGAFKLMAGMQHNSDLALGSSNGAASGVSNLVVTGSRTFTADTIDGATIGVEVPVGGLARLAANYTRLRYQGAAGASDNLGKLAIGGWYYLSKSTMLYASGYFATGGLKDYIAQKSMYQAGVRTSF